MEQILDRDLVIVQEPCSQLHAFCNRKLLDLAFFSHIAMGIDEQPDQTGSAARDARRRDGEAILAFFNGNWLLDALVHHCQGCCASREVAVKKGVAESRIFRVGQ